MVLIKGLVVVVVFVVDLEVDEVATTELVRVVGCLVFVVLVEADFPTLLTVAVVDAV